MKDELTVADDLLFNTVDKFKTLDKSRIADNQEMTRHELEIYGNYFSVLTRIAENPHSDGKTETARAYIGRHIHPSYMLMPHAINLYASHAAAFPPEERVDLISPLADLMLVIGTRWRDAECAAMNVRMSIDEISAMDTSGTITQPILDRLIAECKRIEQSLRDNLKALAEIMTADTAKQSSEILAAVQDVGRKVDATRTDVAEAEERTQMTIHDRFKSLEPMQAGVELLVEKKSKRSRDGKKAQAKAAVDPDIAETKKRAADDMRRAIERVRDDPNVKAGKHGAISAACQIGRAHV